MELGQSDEISAPVISLTIIDRATLRRDIVSSTKILAVVRDPKTNDTHPNVISMPTQRIPPRLCQEILGSTTKVQKLRSTHWYYAPTVDNSLENGNHPIIYGVEALLSRKLGLAEHLEAGRFRFQAALRLAMTGKSYLMMDSTHDQVQHILMANILVIIFAGARLFPPKTASYSHILWVEVGKFIQMVDKKDPTALGAGLNPIEYCVHGLCISTTYELLTRMLWKSQRDLSV